MLNTGSDRGPPQQRTESYDEKKQLPSTGQLYLSLLALKETKNLDFCLL